MKQLLLATTLLLPLGAAAQTAASFPLKKANVIVVRTTDSLGVVYSKLGRALVAAGYGIEKNDKELGTIQTTPHATERYKAVTVGARIALVKEAEGTAIEIRGTYRVANDINGTPVSNIGQRGSATAAAWSELERVAKLYPGGIIAYRIER